MPDDELSLVNALSVSLSVYQSVMVRGGMEMLLVNKSGFRHGSVSFIDC